MRVVIEGYPGGPSRESGNGYNAPVVVPGTKDTSPDAFDMYSPEPIPGFDGADFTKLRRYVCDVRIQTSNNGRSWLSVRYVGELQAPTAGAKS